MEEEGKLSVHTKPKLTQEKSRIRETKHLSTDADCSTDAIGGWTRIPRNLIFF